MALVAGAAVTADQVTKQVVTSTVAIDDSVHVLGPLSIHHVQNTGIAFGLFAGSTAIVAVVTAAAIVWMLVFFARSAARHPVLPAAFGLVIGGSLSNLFDRVRLGHVTDFVDINWWTFRIFNLAESFIVIGVAILLVALSSPIAYRVTRRARRALGGPPSAAGTRLDSSQRRSGSRAAPSATPRARWWTRRAAESPARGRSASRLPWPERAAPTHVPQCDRYEDEHVLVVDKPAGLVVHLELATQATRSWMHSRAGRGRRLTGRDGTARSRHVRYRRGAAAVSGCRSS